MGRGHFYNGSRKMRAFSMNLSPGLEDAHHGDPYFAYGKFDFAYGTPAAFHHDFFGQHHGGPPGNLPFNPAGKKTFILSSPYNTR